VAERGRHVAAVRLVLAHFKNNFGHGGQCAEWRTGFNSRVRGGDTSRAFFEIRNRDLRVVLQGVEVLVAD
jgi:hypothetical protein